MADLTPTRVTRAASPTEVEDSNIVDTGDGTTTVTVGNDTVEITGGRLVIASMPPVSADAPGVAGSIAYDANFFYQCVATDTWVRAALETW